MEIDHIHFYVEDAARQRDWLIEKMGFQSISHQINHQTHTEMVTNNHVNFIISSPLSFSSPVARYLKSHPPGVADIAFRIENLSSFLEKAKCTNQQILQPTIIAQLTNGQVKSAKIRGWGSLNHTLIDQSSSRIFSYSKMIPKTNIVGIDHVVLNVPKNQFYLAVNWYKTLFGLQTNQSFKIETKRSGLSSEALIDASKKIQFNINQPSSNNSQIQEFLEKNNGSGIQHIGLQTTNILQTVAQMRQHGLQFLPIPLTYYQKLKQSAKKLKVEIFSQLEWEKIQTEQILVCWPQYEPQLILMQIFTKPIFDQPTFFFEFIERRNQAKGFGEGNFQALFEAIETEQIKRKYHIDHDQENFKQQGIVKI
ncbi:MAG TPA: 4-hydroxyphenylpyruvate dioxygenase [Cyanothece sp. UBA12306]|nr:4-hydroxyphenylpyruvate dioxygenase [Cyanothece sp. UBA12306]